MDLSEADHWYSQAAAHGFPRSWWCSFRTWTSALRGAFWAPKEL